MENYIKKIKENCKKNAKILILGNKSDSENQRKVSKKEGLDYANSNDCLFYEVSCSKNENIAKAFETLIESNELEKYDNNLVLSKEKFSKKEKKQTC